MSNNNGLGKLGVYTVVGLAVLAFFGLMASFVTIDEGERAVVTTWGEVTGEMDPGMNFRVPIAQDVYTYDVREQVVSYGVNDVEGSIELGSLEANTRSGTEAITDVTLTFSLDGKNVTDVYKRLGSQERYYDTLVKNSVDRHTRDSIAQYTIDELHTSEGRKNLAEDIRRRVQNGHSNENGFSDYGFTVERVQVRNIKFPERVTQEIENSQAAEYELERREKEVEIAKAEAEKRRQEAKGLRDSEKIATEAFESESAYLQYLFITEALANEKATNPIYVPTSNGGLDMFKDIDNVSGPQTE